MRLPIGLWHAAHRASDMSLIQWSGFSGEVRALHPKLLGNGAGTTSLNQKPGRGDLRPWRVPLSVASVPAGRKTIYRMGRDVNDEANYWLSWNTRVHAMRGFEADNTTERTYYTGDGVPKVTDNTIALASTPYPTAARLLGVPAPTAALTGQSDRRASDFTACATASRAGERRSHCCQ